MHDFARAGDMADVTIERGKTDAEEGSSREQNNPTANGCAHADHIAQQSDEVDLGKEANSALQEDQDGGRHSADEARDNAFAEIVENFAFPGDQFFLFLAEAF